MKYVIDAFEGGNASRFAERAGISRYAVSRMRNDRILVAPYAGKIVAAYPLVSLQWLLLGRGDPPMHLSELERVEKMARELRRELKRLNERLDEVERQHKEIMEMYNNQNKKL